MENLRIIIIATTVCLIALAVVYAEPRVTLEHIPDSTLENPYLDLRDLKFCQECQEEGKKSTVHRGMCMTTAMHCPEYWDENGVYHFDPCNTTTCTYYCSEGHEWGEEL